MIYLLSQILLALLLAGVAGGAFGWLLHRWRTRDHADHLHEAILRLQRQLAQADTDRSLLSNDYDELSRHSQDELAQLRAQTREMQPLRHNLEKSQLLVKQMIQQHDSEVAELKSDLESHRQRLRQLAAPARERVRARDEGHAPEIPAPAPAHAPAQAPRSNWASAPVPDVVDSARTASADIEPGSVDAAVIEPEVVEPAYVEPAFVEPAVITPAVVEVDIAEPVPPEPDSEAQEDDTLFAPVDQIDDLQQIVGIGPVTEQALNRLGITSYSQLAELKHHQIEKIAAALKIGPARIRNDDWAGAARRQLEEVLEDLEDQPPR